jgi:hypothetical protein
MERSLKGFYETARIDEKSTPVSTINTKVFIEPGLIILTWLVRMKVFISVNESASSNVIFSRNLGDGTEVFKNIVASGVIHEIDKVIRIDLIKTK